MEENKLTFMTTGTRTAMVVGAVVAGIVVAATLTGRHRALVLQTPAQEIVPAQETPVATPDVQTTATRETPTGPIAAAISSDTVSTCTYVTTIDGTAYRTTVTAGKGAFRADTAAGGLTTHMLYDGDTQYLWTDGDTTPGMVITGACADELRTAAAASPDAATMMPTDPRAAFGAATNVTCTAGGTLQTTPPPTIRFTDQCAMLRQARGDNR